MKIDQSLGLVFFALALLYFLTVLIAIIRVVKLHNYSSEWRTSKVFYVSLALQAFFRGLFMVLILSQTLGSTYNTLFCLLSVPDSLFVVSYLILFWQYLSVFYFAHIENTRSELLRSISKRPMQSKPSMIVLLSILTWSITQAALYFVLLADALSPWVLEEEIGLVEAIIPTIIITLMVFLQIKFSGSPLQDRSWRKKLNRMTGVTSVWTCSCLLRSAFQLYDSYSPKPYSQMLTDSSSKINFESAVLLITYYIVGELFCYFLTLDYSFMGIFVFSEQEDHLQTQPMASERLIARARGFSYLPSNPLLNENQIDLREQVETRKNGLGSLIKGFYMERPVMYRRIVFSRLSDYVLEDLTEEVSSLREHVFEGTLPVVGVCIQLPSLGIVAPLMKGSLYSILHSDNLKLGALQKLDIVVSIAKCMDKLHTQNQFHGHLSSSNVLLDNDLNPFVADLGLRKLKKYAGIMLNYSNKTAWSSPEQLRERSSATVKAVASDDVYSFGVIFWELMTEQLPFPGYSRQKLFQKVAVENFRPQIPDELPDFAIELLKSCWNIDPTMRPDFNSILVVLERSSMTVN